MSDWIIAIILGIVEGITEFLPVSSTGHLLIVERWLNCHQSDLFNIVIQCGAVIAVIPLFPERINQFIFRWREPATRDYLAKIFVAFAITGAIGFVIDKKGFKLPENPHPIGMALLIGGVLFLVVEYLLKGKSLGNQVTWSIAIAVGIGQLIAGVFPGTSRSGATIIFALLLGLNRPAATEFSFLVGIPTMLAVGAWKILKELRHHDITAPHEKWGMILLTTVIAAVVSFIAVKWLLRYVQTHTFIAFGWYRIAIGIFVLLALRSEPNS